MPRAKKQTPAEVLYKAADHIDEVGLYKQDFFKDRVWSSYNGEDALIKLSKTDYKDVPCCALGAIYFASNNLKEFKEAADLLEQSLPVRYHGDVPEWNDMKNRRKGQVVGKLREVAAEVGAPCS